MAIGTLLDAKGRFTSTRACQSAFAIDRLVYPDPHFFRKQYLEKNRPAIVTLSPDRRPDQFGWNLDRLTELVRSQPVPVYDWGKPGPTTDDNFVNAQRPFDRALPPG